MFKKYYVNYIVPVNPPYFNPNIVCTTWQMYPIKHPPPFGEGWVLYIVGFIYGFEFVEGVDFDDVICSAFADGDLVAVLEYLYRHLLPV